MVYFYVCTYLNLVEYSDPPCRLQTRGALPTQDNLTIDISEPKEHSIQ